MRLLLSGCTATLNRIRHRYSDVLGTLITPATGNRLGERYGLPWAADNGAFTGFNEAAFRRLLARCKGGPPGCLFVVAPDVVGDSVQTLALFDTWESVVRNESGQPVALVGQDGAEDTEIPWDRFEAWFIGGSTRWKLSQASADLVQEARRRGKWVHVGRVNSFRRLMAAHDMGCQSCDGTGMSRWGDMHLEKFCKWVRRIKEQSTLPWENNG